MGILSKTLSNLLDNEERQALSLWSKARRRAIDTFSMDFGVKTDYIKETSSDLKVTIPFNEKEEKYDYSVNDGVIEVKVKGDGVFRKATSTIPSDCVTDELSVSVDKENSKLIVTIPKKAIETENSSRSEVINDALKERAKTVASSTTAPKSKRNGRRPNRWVKPRIVVGKNGKIKTIKKGA